MASLPSISIFGVKPVVSFSADLYAIITYGSCSSQFVWLSFTKTLSIAARVFIISSPEFYGDLVYKFKKIRDMTDFSDQFRKIIMRYKRIGYNLNVMRQSACLVINPITVDGYAALFNCTPVDRASDSMMAPT